MSIVLLVVLVLLVAVWSLVRFILLRTSWTCDMPPSMKCARCFLVSFIHSNPCYNHSHGFIMHNVGDVFGFIAVVMLIVIGLFVLDQE